MLATSRPFPQPIPLPVSVPAQMDNLLSFLSLPSISILPLESIRTVISCTELLAVVIIKFRWIDYQRRKFVEDPYELLSA